MCLSVCCVCTAASLGQVYKGVLRETGEVVAVKVQRPGIGESIAVDMLLLRRLMAAVDKNLPQISQPLVPLVDEFAARLFAELDYEAEGKNAEKFQVCVPAFGGWEFGSGVAGAVERHALAASNLARNCFNTSVFWRAHCCSVWAERQRSVCVLCAVMLAGAVWQRAACAHSAHLLASHEAASAHNGVD